MGHTAAPADSHPPGKTQLTAALAPLTSWERQLETEGSMAFSSWGTKSPPTPWPGTVPYPAGSSTGKIKPACSHPKKSQHQYPQSQPCPLLPNRARGTACTSPALEEPTLLCCFAVEAIERDPVFSRENQYFQSQNERYEAAVRKAVHLQKKMDEMGWTDNGPEFKYIYR